MASQSTRRMRAHLRSVLFFAWMPMYQCRCFLPQSLPSVFRVNLPLSVALVWISNPLTMPPMFYGAYLFGVKLLGSEEHPFSFELSIDWFMQSLGTIAAPLLVGCLVIGVLSSILSYGLIRLLWRFSVVSEYNKRKQRK